MIRLLPLILLAAAWPTIAATNLGPDKCERVKSACIEGPETRRINGRDVFRSCWRYAAVFNCVDLDPKTDCNQPRFGACQQQGSPRCIDRDAFDGFCTAEQTSFLCQVANPTGGTVTDCSTQTFTTNDGVTWDTGHPPDSDFARSVTLLEAEREAGRYIDQNSLEVFKGFDSRCSKKLFGLVNCCNRAGSPFDGAFSNFALIPGITGGPGSSYTNDSLFSAYLGGASPLDFIKSRDPVLWTTTMMQMQIAGLFTCEDRDKETALKRDQRLCADVGEYCSGKLAFIRTCTERTHTYCCFNSRLARLINEQGRGQLHKNWGDPEHPDCSGFSVEQLQTLDFAKMDLTEFYAEIAPKDADLPKWQSDANEKASSCYYGQGQC